MEAPPARRTMCVTGAGGFIASWLVKLLLSRGHYVVNGTVRDRDVIAPTATGTLNVLKACYELEVKRVVVVSSVAAVFNNPNWPKGKVFNEDSWSDEEYCRKNEEWYFLSKTLAQREAFAYAARTGLDIVTI